MLENISTKLHLEHLSYLTSAPSSPSSHLFYLFLVKYCQDTKTAYFHGSLELFCECPLVSGDLPISSYLVVYVMMLLLSCLPLYKCKDSSAQTDDDIGSNLAQSRQADD